MRFFKLLVAGMTTILATLALATDDAVACSESCGSQTTFWSCPAGQACSSTCTQDSNGKVALPRLLWEQL
jgi:hypothetical protein